MAGFLDKNERIIDMVLTGEGKYLLSRGELNFVHFVVFDNEVDYDPYIINSGSYDAATLSASINTYIEDTLVREATSGYIRTNKSGSDFTNVFNPIFSIPQGQNVLPRMKVFIEPTGSINVKQQKVIDYHTEKDNVGNITQLIESDIGVRLYDASNATFEVGYEKDNYPNEHKYEGFLVRVYKSGSGGLEEIGQKHDLQNDISFGNELKLFAGGVAGTVK